MELKKYKLCEICDINKASLKATDNIEEILYLDTSNITENTIAELQYFKRKNAPSRAQRKIQDKTIIFSTVRPNQNHFGIMNQPKENLIVSSGFTTLDIKNKEEFDANYVYLKLTQPAIVDYLQTLAQNSVSSYPSINPDDIGNLCFQFPPLQTQRKIAAILSALDDKIALNRRINAKLEAMAKRLYDYWFVQFDFPNADGKPYKSSGGKMEYNEVIKREIPAGWEVKLLGEVCNFPIDRVSEKNINGKLYVPIEVIPRNEMSFSETANIEKAASGLCSFDKRSILLSNRRVYFHKVCIAPFGGITRDTVIIINPEDLKNLGFIYQIVNSNHFIDYATLNSYGSEQPVLSTPTVQDYKFVCPNMGFDKTYSEKVNGIINKVLENNLEIRKLTAMRDRLLPLLMNGQVEVK